MATMHYKSTAGTAGSPNGNAGTTGGDNSSINGGAGFALNTNMEVGSYGKGGSVDSSTNATGWFDANASGGSGGYVTSTITVTPGQTLTVVVGSGGAAANNNDHLYTSGGDHVDAGGNGAVLIRYTK